MIPLKIETLLEGRVVEHDRVEYKTGWNPNDIIHSICALRTIMIIQWWIYSNRGKRGKWNAGISACRCAKGRIRFNSAGDISVLQYDCAKIHSKNGDC